jgi:hypothetical protein
MTWLRRHLSRAAATTSPSSWSTSDAQTKGAARSSPAPGWPAVFTQLVKAPVQFRRGRLDLAECGGGLSVAPCTVDLARN